MDLDEQAPARCHRLNSTADLQVWSVTCAGSVEVVLEELLSEKSASARLALDGRGVDMDNLDEVLDTTAMRFTDEPPVAIPEADLERQLNALLNSRPRIDAAHQ